MTPILQVEDLSVEFQTTRGVVTAVDELSFDLRPGETLAIVGESGSGKSTAALALMRLINEGAGRIRRGRILFEGTELLALPEHRMRNIRGGRIGMIFQDPMMALNPVFTVGWQIAESLRQHLGLDHTRARAQVIELLDRVGIPAPDDRFDQYPHNLSGGMRQRVMIAMALACRPSLLIADEPTTALDVTVQAQVLDLIKDLKHEFGMAVLLITHDLAVVWETAERVVVMDAGRKVEEGPVAAILQNPRHPYTRGLLKAASWQEDGGALFEIPGTVPSPYEMPSGCRFAPRCDRAVPPCQAALPPLTTIGSGWEAACLFANEAGA